MLLVACGGDGTQVADTPSPETKVLPKADIGTSTTLESPNPEPTNPTTPILTPTLAPIASGGQSISCAHSRDGSSVSCGGKSIR